MLDQRPGIGMDVRLVRLGDIHVGDTSFWSFERLPLPCSIGRDEAVAAARPLVEWRSDSEMRLVGLAQHSVLSVAYASPDGT